MLMGSRATSNPTMAAAPEVGSTLVMSTPMVVVLPAPLGPNSPKISPSGR